MPESAVAAQVFMREAFAANDGIIPTDVHSDNGPSMTSKNVAQLLVDLNITRYVGRNTNSRSGKKAPVPTPAVG